MHITSEHRVGDVVERHFFVGEIPGILWQPEYATPTEPVPMILAGQPGGFSLGETYSRMFARAQHAARAGFATVTIELPGSGDRPSPAGVDEARAEMREAVMAGERVSGDIIDRLILPLADQAVLEWQLALDTLLGLPEIGARVGYSGGLISIAVRLAAMDPRIAAAALFAGSFVPRCIVEEARRVTIPLHVLLQWDDEHNDRDTALELFDAFGSREKTLNANMGGHTGVPQHAAEEADRFFARHLSSFIADR